MFIFDSNIKIRYKAMKTKGGQKYEKLFFFVHTDLDIYLYEGLKSGNGEKTGLL